jgi:hypothetical protein
MLGWVLMVSGGALAFVAGYELHDDRVGVFSCALGVGIVLAMAGFRMALGL